MTKHFLSYLELQVLDSWWPKNDAGHGAVQLPGADQMKEKTAISE